MTDWFYDLLPMAITYGMSVKEFWEDNPDLFWAYRFSYYEKIKNEQEKLFQNVEQYHKVNMKNFEKLRDFNEICDMTNQVFETRLSNIEQILKEKLMNI